MDRHHRVTSRYETDIFYPLSMSTRIPDIPDNRYLLDIVGDDYETPETLIYDDILYFGINLDEMKMNR